MLITDISYVHRIRLVCLDEMELIFGLTWNIYFLKLHAFTYLLPAFNSNQLMEANYRTCLLDEFVGKITLCQIIMLLTSCVGYTLYF